ncbi:hypothetical protein [Pseudomonas syringae]|uniref:hypothetical protein n=1 Tax=Pseudomonas syringae TaxID=317 RepID=UPI0012691A04|nr:hypothetical protein [Pseudomonas syringae]
MRKICSCERSAASARNHAGKENSNEGFIDREEKARLKNWLENSAMVFTVVRQPGCTTAGIFLL